MIGAIIIAILGSFVLSTCYKEVNLVSILSSCVIAISLAVAQICYENLQKRIAKLERTKTDE